MFLCPLTGSRLIKARAGGGTLWYSPGSDDRMLTVATARHFFGPDKTREIWMRSDRAETLSNTPCPCCHNPMRHTELPDWIGADTIDVCRTCRIFWLEAASFDEVPRGSQLLHARGDSTLVKDLGEAYIEHYQIKSEKEKITADGVIQEPDSVIENILGQLRLPLERSNRPTPEWPIVSGATLALMLILQVFVTDQSLIEGLGFYPNDLLKNFGFNIFSNVFIHTSWFHLLANLYFAFILSDDVEDDLGSKKFLGFLGFTVVAEALVAALISGSRDIPHVGYSGVVMALFAYYGLQFPKAKIIWFLPRIHLANSSSARGPLFTWAWFQFRALWIAFFYFAADFIYYLAQEMNSKESVSFSGHIAGFLAGVLFWSLFAPKTLSKEKPDILEKNMDRLVQREPRVKLPQPHQQLQLTHSNSKDDCELK